MSDELSDRLSKRFDGPEGDVSKRDSESEPESESKPHPESESEPESGPESDEPSYDPETDPAFEYEQREMQNSVYVRKDTWKQYQALRKMVDAQATAKGYESIAGRELDDAILRAAADLDAEDIADRVADAREQRADE